MSSPEPGTTPRKINVLHLRSCRGGGGGPEKTILFSAKEVDRSQFNLHIAYLTSRDDNEFDLDARARAMGIDTFVRIKEDKKIDFRALKELRQLIEEKDIDILSCHCYKSDLYGLYLKRKVKKLHLLSTAHGPLASLKFFWASQNWRVRYLYDQIDLRILRFFERVIIVSDTMRSAVARHKVPNERIIWIRNAIDSTYFKKSAERRAEYRKSLGIAPDATVVGAVGRLNGEKDYPNFLGMAAELLKTRPEVVFTIAGGGALEAELKKLAGDLGLSEKVRFLGHFQDVRKVYDLLDVYVLSSTREGLPNTVLEAMAMEVPIVSTNVDGVCEAVEDRRDALLVPARDPVALARAVDSVLADLNLRDRIVASSRRRVEEEFSFAHRMRKIESIYRDMMGFPQPSGAVPVASLNEPVPAK